MLTMDLLELLDLNAAKEVNASGPLDSTSGHTSTNVHGVELAVLETAAVVASDRAGAVANALRPGSRDLLRAATVEWRRQRGVQDATTAARKLLLAEQENEFDAAMRRAGEGNALASPPTDLREASKCHARTRNYMQPSVLQKPAPITCRSVLSILVLSW